MFISVNISQQQLHLHGDDGRMISYPVSTGLNGVGQQEGSGQTPLGKHVIRAKIGRGAPECAVFVGRRWTGEIYSPELAILQPERKDWILTRILWLSGKEVGVNRLGSVDSMRRYIYIHGTPDSSPMGRPESKGCIRMRNKDVIDLFEQVAVGTLIDIVSG
ncbi:L,D-transpeptidase [Endozoicomonas sp. Mp262]|uniref:L,D-transpeptidase family protein n=1 Tax=Endozoicomonas sp. Mp262 TaxID=2919499 RepID=UPI0021D9516A